MSQWGIDPWGAGAGAGGDGVDPTIANISPAPGTAIKATQAITFDVTDETALSLVSIAASYAGDLDRVDLVFDGDGFRGRYRSSTVEAIAGGFRFVVRRSGGWPTAPTLEYIALDYGGNRAVIA